ncbi:hypothetical protein ACLK1T_09455 [Escherichia coli]
MMLNLYADWCVACKELRNTPSATRRCKRRQQTRSYLANVTANDAQDVALFKHLMSLAYRQFSF